MAAVSLVAGVPLRTGGGGGAGGASSPTTTDGGEGGGTAAAFLFSLTWAFTIVPRQMLTAIILRTFFILLVLS